MSGFDGRVSNVMVRSFLRWAMNPEEMSANNEVENKNNSVSSHNMKKPQNKGEFPNIEPYRGLPISVRAFYARGLAPRGIVKDDWSSYKGYGKRLMLCPIHEDAKPSMGTLIDRDGTELFHCLGCGQAGTVVDLAQKVMNHKRIHPYSTPLEWVIRACSGEFGVDEFNRFISHFDVNEIKQTSIVSNNGLVRGRRVRLDFLELAAGVPEVGSVRGAVGIQRSAQRLLMASLEANNE